MPTSTDTPIDAYAHCLNPRCAGYAQESVKALRRETFYTFADLGGDANMPGYERSIVGFHFADETDAACPSCESPRAVTPEARTQYQNLSGHDPNGLLHILPGDAPNVADLQAEIAALKAKVGDAA
jgi:hypothetical protein